MTALHPNLKMVGHDKAHSFRRVLKPPYAADPVLEGLMENHCLGKDSMVQVISNSADFRLWFEDCVKTQSASNGTEGFGDKAQIRVSFNSLGLDVTVLTCIPDDVPENGRKKEERQVRSASTAIP